MSGGRREKKKKKRAGIYVVIGDTPTLLRFQKLKQNRTSGTTMVESCLWGPFWY